MMVVILIGLLLAAGILIAATSFGVSQPLDDLWSFHDRAAEAGPVWFNPDDATPLGFAGAAIAKALSIGNVDQAVQATSFSRDLAVAGRDLVDFAAHALIKILIVIGLGVAVVVVAPETAATGRVFGLVLAVGLLAVLVDVQNVQTVAKRRRSEILEAVTAFVEFTRLASHTQSIEGAMRASVGMGASWPFRRLETIFDQAERHRQPPWRGLTALGHRYGMLELVELGGALENAGTEGTRVQAMLAAKATSLRRRMTEEEIEKAMSATQRLSVPLGLMGVVLVAVLLAPAVLAY